EITNPSCNVALVRRKMGMVFQSFNLFDNFNVLDNVCRAPIKLLHVPADEARTQAMDLLRRVGLDDKAQSFADDLSGGQQQRVAIARAVAMRPKILLLDEPTSALDPTMIAEVLTVIRELAREGMTMIIITHEMRFARTISNRVFYMDEGGIYEQGSPEDIFDHPTREKTRQFIKRLKTLRLSVDTSSIDYLGTVTQLDRFGSDAELSPHTLHNVTLAIEELIFQCIMPAAHEQGTALTIDVVVEYSESDGALMLQIEWGGAPYDPLTNGNELCLAIVKSVVRQAEYRYEDTNKVICSI
ncbi:MAG: ATP-binding cassette domain-containing protein, partial [Atopobiaceae bacterium]|nr:ATP-binding cassette domain-containing protein [Atopobiaceae bacterium]